MDDSHLPPELACLERLLASGPRPEPSFELRRRVLGSVRSELHRTAAWPKWRFSLAFAAVLLVGFGLSLSVLQATTLALQPNPSPPSVYEIARRLQELSPGLSRDESLRQATLRQIGAEVSGRVPFGEIPSQRDLL